MGSLQSSESRAQTETDQYYPSKLTRGVKEVLRWKTESRSVNSLNMNENDRSWMKTVMIIRNDMRNYFGLSFANKWGFFSDHHMSTLIHRFSFWLDYPSGHQSIGEDDDSRIHSTVISSDGCYLYTGGRAYLSKWNLCNHDLVKSWKETDWRIECLAYHKRGRLISADYQATIRVRNAFKNDELIHIMKGHTLNGHSNRVTTMDTNVNGTLLLSGSEDHTMRLWSLKSGECLRLFVGHTHSIRCVRFRYDGKLMSSSLDQSIRIWHPSLNQCQQIISEANSGAVSQMSINKDASILACAADSGIFLYSLPEMEVVQMIQESAKLCQFHPLNPNILAVFNQHIQRVRILDVSNGETINLSENKIGTTYDLFFSPDGSRLICVYNYRHYVKIWDISHVN